MASHHASLLQQGPSHLGPHFPERNPRNSETTRYAVDSNSTGRSPAPPSLTRDPQGFYPSFSNPSLGLSQPSECLGLQLPCPFQRNHARGTSFDGSCLLLDSSSSLAFAGPCPGRVVDGHMAWMRGCHAWGGMPEVFEGRGSALLFVIWLCFASLLLSFKLCVCSS